MLTWLIGYLICFAILALITGYISKKVYDNTKDTEGVLSVAGIGALISLFASIIWPITAPCAVIAFIVWKIFWKSE